jgi:hypothetical protein
MSGPITRSYGFPNFEQIFGKRDLQHGVDEPESAPAPQGEKAEGQTPAEPKPAEPTAPGVKE